MSKSAVEHIKDSQRRWATHSGRALDDRGYCGCDDDNIHGGLSDSARREFAEGGGKELGGKIRATHSSSALACNWFDYWRERDFSALSEAFGVPSPFVSLRLEAKLPTGMRGADANLDVLLTTADGALFGIESKFSEPYVPSPSKFHLKPQYFSQNRTAWTDAGLSGCQAVAERLRAGEHDFTVLDVAQLLKHMLALARTGSHWTLCCLWYEVPGQTATAHRADLAAFAKQIGDDARHFVSLTYQELFARMEPVVSAEHSDYLAYLRDRYMASESTV
jgi:hypothetical protein